MAGKTLKPAPAVQQVPANGSSISKHDQPEAIGARLNQSFPTPSPGTVCTQRLDFESNPSCLPNLRRFGKHHVIERLDAGILSSCAPAAQVKPSISKRVLVGANANTCKFSMQTKRRGTAETSEAELRAGAEAKHHHAEHRLQSSTDSAARTNHDRASKSNPF